MMKKVREVITADKRWSTQFRMWKLKSVCQERDGGARKRPLIQPIHLWKGKSWKGVSISKGQGVGGI